MFGEVVCPWRKCNVRYKECGNKTGNEGRKDEEEKKERISTVAPRPSGALTTTHDHKSRSGLCSIRSLCAYSCHMIPLRLPPPPPPSLFPFTYTVPVGGSKTTSYISAGGEREKGRGAARGPSHRRLKGCWSLVSYRRQSQATPCELKEK